APEWASSYYNKNVRSLLVFRLNQIIRPEYFSSHKCKRIRRHKNEHRLFFYKPGHLQGGTKNTPDTRNRKAHRSTYRDSQHRHVAALRSPIPAEALQHKFQFLQDRKSTRLNSSHVKI